MGWFLVMYLFSTVLDWLSINRLCEQDKALEILVLWQQLAIAERKLDKPLHLSRVEKLTLAVMAVKLKTVSGRTIKQFQDIIRLVQPETVFKWHRELVRRKWTYANHKPCGGRPRTDKDTEILIVQLARENTDWGYGKIQGELGKLGYAVSEQTVANILARHAIPPSPQRQSSVGWRHLMQHYKQQLLACDFFTVETRFLNTVYVLFFIEVGSRHVHVAGCTTQPTSAWVTQQARQVVWTFQPHDPAMRFLIHDRDTKCPIPTHHDSPLFPDKRDTPGSGGMVRNQTSKGWIHPYGG